MHGQQNIKKYIPLLPVVIPCKFPAGNLKKYTKNSYSQIMWKEATVAYSEIQITFFF
jgi:hypothetical protein